MAVAKQCIVCAPLYPFLLLKLTICICLLYVLARPSVTLIGAKTNTSLPLLMDAVSCLIGAAPNPLSAVTSSQLLQGLPLHIQLVAVFH